MRLACEGYLLVIQSCAHVQSVPREISQPLPQAHENAVSVNEDPPDSNSGKQKVRPELLLSLGVPVLLMSVPASGRAGDALRCNGCLSNRPSAANLCVLDKSAICFEILNADVAHLRVQCQAQKGDIS